MAGGAELSFIELFLNLPQEFVSQKGRALNKLCSQSGVHFAGDQHCALLAARYDFISQLIAIEIWHQASGIWQLALKCIVISLTDRWQPIEDFHF